MIAAVLAAALVHRGAPAGWRLAVLPLVYFGALGILQARAKT